MVFIILFPLSAIDEWRKRRANGQISDLDNQYGDPKEQGGIPFPMASFGGEFEYISCSLEKHVSITITNNLTGT